MIEIIRFVLVMGVMSAIVGALGFLGYCVFKLWETRDK